MKVFVYRNLRKKCWSIRYKGKVIQHCDYLTLQNCMFKISQKGRERVIRTGRKTVHAGVVGDMTEVKVFPSPSCNLVPLRYNPKETATFVRADNGEPIHAAKYVLLDYPRVYAFYE